MTVAMDREQIRGWIEEATGEGLSVSDALPDTLAATGEALGLKPLELRMWIFDRSLVTIAGELSGWATRPAAAWTAAELVEWARRYALAKMETP